MQSFEFNMLQRNDIIHTYTVQYKSNYRSKHTFINHRRRQLPKQADHHTENANIAIKDTHRSV